MTSTRSSKPLRSMVFALWALGAAFLGAQAAPGQDVPGLHSGALVMPDRRAPEAPPAGPPAVPARAEAVPALTLDVVIRNEAGAGPAVTYRQRISRTADRIHVATAGNREWLFLRNLRDRRRVSGYLVDHASRAVVFYDESDLRNALGVRGWLDVFTLGFDSAALGRLSRTDSTRTVGHLRFARYRAPGTEPTREVWWSDAHYVPGEFVIAAGRRLRFTTEHARAGVDEALLRAPDSRFPQYHLYDLAEWLERH